MNVKRSLPIIFAFFVSLPVFAVIDEESCDRDRDQLIVSLDEQRVRMLEKIERVLDETSDQSEQEHLRYRRDQVWDYDEQMRGTAEQIWRDCMLHVEAMR